MINVKVNFISLVIVTLLIILLIILLSVTAHVNLTNENMDTSLFPGTQSSHMKRDCDQETIYSMEDAQCSAICKNNGTYRTKNGICVNALIFNQTIVEAECDPKKGILAYLTGNTQFGNTSLLCLSIDIGIQPNDPSKPNKICTSGDIDIDYTKSFPQLNDCHCPEGSLLATIPETTTIRMRGVCIDEKLKTPFQYNKLLFDSHII